jgi:hypothetical protein
LKKSFKILSTNIENIFKRQFSDSKHTRELHRSPATVGLQKGNQRIRIVQQFQSIIAISVFMK